jgi:prepilin signal peptidase PulO-like enzyme (type II secretory pathway)
MIPLLLIFLGLVLGSFVNAFVWRIHKHKDWVNDRSECTRCHHKLGPLDLIPVLSWVMLRGKCRYCHKKIEDTPFTELMLPAVFLLSYFYWPMELTGRGMVEFVFWLVLLVGLLALTVYDLRWFLLPDKIVFPLLGLAFLQVLISAIVERDIQIVTMAVACALIISGIFYILFQLSKGTWIGGGDVKLALVLGLLCTSLLEPFLLLFTASVAGLIGSLPAIVKGKAKAKTQIPFGPFLIIGLIVVRLFGNSIISWYTGILYV